MSGAEKFYDAITQVREDLVEEALDYRFTRRRTIRWQRYVPLAACLALVVYIGYLAANLRMGGMNTAGGNDGSDNSAATGESAGAADDGALPGDGGDTTVDGALPPANDFESGGGSAGGGALTGSVPALGLTAEAEGLTAARELTLEFAADGTVYATDVYTLANAGTEPATAALAFDDANISCSVDGAAAENGAPVSLAAGESAEIILRSRAAVDGDVLALASPGNLTVTQAVLVLRNLPEGTVVSGTEPFDQIIQE